MQLDIGSRLPDLTSATDGGGELSLASLRGQKWVLYFYPKDNTTGCTAEACEFRDAMVEFADAGVAVIGVSKDSARKHDNFKAKHGLSFPLISDEEGQLCEAFGVWKEKKLYGRSYMGIERSTFLIDEHGVIIQAWRNVRVKGHVAAVLEAVQRH
ncbi:MAG: thioredoxin-dependent thiol peroxidase [Proteobacteria bacterium]|nr:thioredoxin-dependent thiol peroxidase [Pseudomonadota bacterium]